MLNLKLPIFVLFIGSIFQQADSSKSELSLKDRYDEILDTFCTEIGFFPNPSDPTGETFIRCELEPIEMRCLPGYHFEQAEQTCISNEINVNDGLMDLWQQILPCSVNEIDRYHRNPFDCSIFYRCYQQGTFHRKAIHYCLPNMVFDEHLRTCITENEYKLRNNHHKCKTLPFPDKYKHLIQKNAPEEEPDNSLETVFKRLKQIFKP